MEIAHKIYMEKMDIETKEIGDLHKALYREPYRFDMLKNDEAKPTFRILKAK